MHTASYVGRKFGIVTFIKEMPPLYQDNIRKYGLERLGGPVRHLGFYFDDVQKGFEDPKPVVDRFVQVVREMVEQDGIDVVIPGELPMHLMLHRAGCHRVDEVPVMDGLGVTVKMAEMLVTLRRTSGLRVNRQNYFYAKPDDVRFDELKSFYHVK
jgi:Asp/Glu/hydantoin racemase